MTTPAAMRVPALVPIPLSTGFLQHRLLAARAAGDSGYLTGIKVHSHGSRSGLASFRGHVRAARMPAICLRFELPHRRPRPRPRPSTFLMPACVASYSCLGSGLN